jgi:hypothetical protein
MEVMSPITLTPPTARQRLDATLANLHVMEPQDAGLVVERLLAQMAVEGRDTRRFSVHAPRSA